MLANACGKSDNSAFNNAANGIKFRFCQIDLRLHQLPCLQVNNGEIVGKDCLKIVCADVCGVESAVTHAVDRLNMRADADTAFLKLIFKNSADYAKKSCKSAGEMSAAAKVHLAL